MSCFDVKYMTLESFVSHISRLFVYSYVFIVQIVSATTRENDGTDKKEGSRTQQISKLIIITSGVLISTGLLLLIGREIYHKFRMSQVHHNRQTSDDSPEDFNIYAEINAPSRGNVIIQQLC